MQLKVLILTVMLATLSSAFARVFVFDDADGQTVHRARPERQVSEYNPLSELELRRRTPRQSLHTRWGLGYDASDILHPPGQDVEHAESGGQYRTLRFFRPEVENPKIIYGTVKRGVVVTRPQRSSPEGSSSLERETQEDEDEEEEDAGYSQEGHSYHHVPASIYSFVKTDPHGNFKWGVHRGASVRG